MNRNSYCNKKLGPDVIARFKSEVQRDSNVIRQRKHRENKKQNDPEALKEKYRKEKQNQRKKMKENNPDFFKESNISQVEKFRKRKKESDLEAFKERNRKDILKAGPR